MIDRNDKNRASAIRLAILVALCLLHVALGVTLMWKGLISPVTCLMFQLSAACFILAALPELRRE